MTPKLSNTLANWWSSPQSHPPAHRRSACAESRRQREMAYRSEIIRALDELIADEGGPLFQTIAVIHAKQKWNRLVACERKWDGGLDAHADGALEPDENGIGLACSITATIGKIKHDARETNRHYPDVRVLIFSTAIKVSSH